jgi:purine-binding chemotaxis protein CheW
MSIQRNPASDVERTSGINITRNSESGKGESIEICSFTVAGSVFALPIRHIVEIVGKVHPQPVPLSPFFIAGLVYYRGNVLTALSLRRLLDVKDCEGPHELLVLECIHGSFGLLVDSVEDLLVVSSADYEAIPGNSDGRFLGILDTQRMRIRGLFAGSYKQGERLLITLNTDELDPMRLAETFA